jgi:hypothetical protein
MRTQFVAIKSPDSVAIMQFVVDDGFSVVREATDENIESEVRETFKDAISWRRIEKSEIPTSREFRDAWEDTGSISVNLEAAKEIHRRHLRKQRVPLFEELDSFSLTALETGDTAKIAEVVAEKQLLRDVTDDPRIDLAASVEELSLLTLSELLK